MNSVQQSVLNPVTIPLVGRQLIEASAGTGKTFNITRIYLRAILALDLGVENILVMTFSKAATQEIRGRVAQTLKEAVEYWQKRLDGVPESEHDDPVYKALYRSFGNEQALIKLQSNRLLIDDAAIFTIHGFCQQMLSTYAYNTGNPLSFELKTDTSKWMHQCIADWLRSLNDSSEQLSLLADNNWHTPALFFAKFRDALLSSIPLTQLTETLLNEDTQTARKAISQRYAAVFSGVYDHMLNNEALLKSTLIEPQKPAKQQQRLEEWETLLSWLQDAQCSKPEKRIKDFYNGNRFRNNKQVADAFAPLKKLVEDITKEADKLDEKAKRRLQQGCALTCVCAGIVTIKKRFSGLKNERGWLEFDDLVEKLAEVAGAQKNVAQAINSLFPIALVDEFQDTDSAQYRLLSAIYPRANNNHVNSTDAHTPASALLMIGDPKQAIYAFRGGDIFTYLSAAQEANGRWVMDTNWRSSAPMVNAYNYLFENAKFDFSMVYQAVNHSDSAKANSRPLHDPQSSEIEPKALQLVWCESESEAITKPVLLEVQARWVGREITRLLHQCKLGDNSVMPSDIAILVRSRNEANAIKLGLDEVGINSVYMSNQQSVFTTQEAHDTLRVLQGIANIDQQSSVRAAIVSPLFGFSNELYTRLFVQQDDTSWEQVLSLVSTLNLVWKRDGILAMLQMLLNDHCRLPNTNAQRMIANYQQLAELLQNHAAQEHALGVREQIQWLKQNIVAPAVNEETSTQRLDDDREAIQIITQHKSKGLEYPIVFVPYANSYRDASRQGSSAALVCRYYDEGKQALVQQVGDSEGAHLRMIREGEAEATRLLYVAVTRAAHRCYLVASPFNDSAKSALGYAVDCAAFESWPHALAQYSKGNPNVHFVDASLPAESSIGVVESHSKGDATSLIAPVSVTIKTDNWRLYSFSALTQKYNSNWRRSRADEYSANDAEGVTTNHAALPARFRFPKGPIAGNALHDVLEKQDFTQRIWHQDAAVLLSSISSNPSSCEAIEWLNEVLDTPFDVQSGRVRLREVPLQSTLREAEFYFSLPQTSRALLDEWLIQLRGQQHASGGAPSDSQLHGMMHGFIDLIFEKGGKYYVADYKSNFMGNAISDYLPEVLLDNMQQHQYDLQASIYSVALHRYLKQCLPEYCPQEHFGGAVYMYLRGMHPDNNNNEGVAKLRLSVAQLLELDALFAAKEQS